MVEAGALQPVLRSVHILKRQYGLRTTANDGVCRCVVMFERLRRST